ncbi:hypothetical protein FRC09_017577, partial [Ceratobasidium sp. 395]
MWGECVSVPGSDKITLQEDTRGADGELNLIAWFWALSYVLAFKIKTAGFALAPTSDAFVVKQKILGTPLEIFMADLDDRRHLQILNYSPTTASDNSTKLQPTVMRYPDPTPESLVPMFAAELSLTEGQQGVTSYNARVEIDFAIEQRALLNGANVKVTQISPCTMRLYVGDYTHVVSYPYPVQGTPNKLRIARKSHYVEVIVSVAEPLGSGGYALDRTPVLHRAGYTPWNIHYLNLDRMPLLNTTDVVKKLPWLTSLTALQLSDEERGAMSGQLEVGGPESTLMPAIKDTIHSTVAMHCALPGKKQRVFGFCEPNQRADVHAALLIGGIRLDLASCSISIDVALIPFWDSMPLSLKMAIDKLLNFNPMARLPLIGDESVAIKKMMPAFVERSRTWKHTPNCEYTATADMALSVEFGHSPICSCGRGIEFDGPEWDISLWKAILPYATRAAICPLFSVP